MPRGRLQKIVFTLTMLALSPYMAHTKDLGSPQDTATAALIKKTNSEVSNLDKKLKSNELQSLKVEYHITQPTDGVAPSFTFYFEDKQDKNILRVCLVRVGHETWSKFFYFYYDAHGKPIKYLEKISGREDNPAPRAILYGASAKILWKNTERPRLSPNQVAALFNQLTTKLNIFSGY